MDLTARNRAAYRLKMIRTGQHVPTPRIVEDIDIPMTTAEWRAAKDAKRLAGAS